MRGALDFKVKDCPVCAVVKNKRPKKPTAVLSKKRGSGSLGSKLSLIHRANLG